MLAPSYIAMSNNDSISESSGISKALAPVSIPALSSGLNEIPEDENLLEKELLKSDSSFVGSNLRSPNLKIAPSPFVAAAAHRSTLVINVDKSNKLRTSNKIEEKREPYKFLRYVF